MAGKEMEIRRPEERRGLTHPFFDLRREIDSLFDNFFAPTFARRGVLADPLAGIEALAPSLDVAETDEAYEVSAELPGMAEEDIDVTVANGLLTLKGEKKEEREEKKKNYYLSERRYGALQRSIALPDNIDEGKITAQFDKGVLTVKLPKTAKAREAIKKIKVGKP